jgi:hypothetical protein
MVLLLRSLTAGFVGPRTPDSAARWPYLTGPATAADEYYEEAAHDVPRVGQPSPGRPLFARVFSRVETVAQMLVTAPRFATLDG